MKNNKINESTLVKKIMKEILPILEQSINEYNSTEWNDIADRFDSMYNTRAGAFARQRGVEARERELHTEYTETMEELSNIDIDGKKFIIGRYIPSNIFVLIYLMNATQAAIVRIGETVLRNIVNVEISQDIASLYNRKPIKKDNVNSISIAFDKDIRSARRLAREINDTLDVNINYRYFYGDKPYKDPNKETKTEGNYDFSFFDHVIERAKAKGLKVIMGTPTATIPAWLAKKHPDILSEFEGGKKRNFGGRHVYCFNSHWMYEYSEKIITALVEHYKDEEAIAAWQIDNEIGHEGSDVCYCKNCQNAFRQFLKVKYEGDIDRLNDVYGTTFWSQEYNSFDEIPTPTETITTHNPALRLDWERFRSKSIVNFIDMQAKLIKKIAPNAVVMHDYPGGGLDKHVDYSDVAESIDQVAYNNYPVWGGQKEPIAPHEIAFGLSYIRGFKRENFWITEAIMGAQGHDVTGFLPRPNQAKMWSYQSIAHGCDSLMYFRYRGATKGAEQFC